MREALAATHHDFVVSETPKLGRLLNAFGAARRPGSPAASRRPKRFKKGIAFFLSAALAATIVLNALSWQKARHPAPLFAPASKPLVPPREPKIAETMAAASRPKPQAVPTPPHDKLVEKTPVANPASPQPQDEIARILTAGPPKPVPSLQAKPTDRPPPPRQKPAQASPKVLKIQQALVRLGFVLKPDGLAGATTKEAVARYERDHGLPAQGQLTPALTRRLLTDAGMTSER
ncbi:MAG TPA: peptidoglycan-binding protein [Methylocella sp.]|nr:peptidoglycan-binding protein [Methylocella sp.]